MLLGSRWLRSNPTAALFLSYSGTQHLFEKQIINNHFIVPCNKINNIDYIVLWNKVSLIIHNHFRVPCKKKNNNTLHSFMKKDLFQEQDQAFLGWSGLSILVLSWLLASFLRLDWSRKLKKWKQHKCLRISQLHEQEYEVHFLKIACKEKLRDS